MTPESTLNKHLEVPRKIEDEYFDSLTNTKDSILIPDLNLLYQRVPKVAGTTISKILLHYLFNDAEGRAIGDANVHYIVGTLLPLISDYPRSYIHEKFTSADTFRFTFVRNPYAKLVSCYKDKFERLNTIRNDVAQGTPIARAMEAKEPHFYEEPKYILYNSRIRVSAGKEPYTPYSSKFEVATFDEFARYVCAQDDAQMEHHWEPQVRTTNWGKVQYNLVGKQESFQDDMHQVIDLLKAPQFLHDFVGVKHNATSVTPTSSYFTPELQKVVYDRYHDDFDAFGYPRELPE